MSYREDASRLVCKQVEEYLESRFETPRKLQFKSTFQAQTSNSEENADMNEFSAALLTQVMQEVYHREHDHVLDLINSEVKNTVEELLTEEEAQEFLKFASSDVGRKVFRNLDLIRESYANGLAYLQMQTIKAWDQPEVNKAIMEYLDSMRDSENDKFEDDEELD